MAVEPSPGTKKDLLLELWNCTAAKGKIRAFTSGEVKMMHICNTLVFDNAQRFLAELDNLAKLLPCKL